QLNDLQAKLTTLDSRREPLPRACDCGSQCGRTGSVAKPQSIGNRLIGIKEHFGELGGFSLKIANLSRLAIRRHVLLNQFRFELQTWLGWNPASMESANCD
ncbi:MAG: hypothetical protein VX936_03425, partial [Planctomycetota bacterium]|nr:hypothetical protein [Planctomycetota bacterium]